jgi:hypothetical protein
MAVGAMLVIPATASASFDVTLSTGATSNGSFVVAGSTATFTPTGNSAVLNVNDLGTELASHDVVVGTSSSGTQSGNITFVAGIGTTSTQSLTFSPGASGATTVKAFSNAANTGSGFAAFTGSIDIGGALTMNGTTVLDLSGTGGSTPLTASSQTYSGAARIKSQSSLSAGGTVAFGGTVDSSTANGEYLGVSAPTASFASTVGGTNPLSQIVLSGTGSFGASVTTTWQISDSSTTLTGPATLSVTQPTVLTSALGDIDGAYALTINAVPVRVSVGSIGATTPPASLTVTSSVFSVGGDITTTGGQTYDTGVLLTGSSGQIVWSSGGGVDFVGPIMSSGSSAVTLAAQHLLSLEDDVSLGGSLTANSPAIGMRGITVTTGGAQTYAGNVIALANATIAPGPQGVDFGNGVDAAQSTTYSTAASLTVNGSATFERGAGSNAPLRSLHTQAATIAGNMRTWGSQTYSGAVTLGNGADIEADYQGGQAGTDDAVSFGGTVDGAHALSFSGDEMEISFGGAVGVTTPLSSLQLGGGSTVSVPLAAEGPGSGYGPFVVAGGVALGNAALNLTVDPGFTPAVGRAIYLDQNTGSSAVSGTFQGLPNGATISKGALRFVLSYTGGDGNDVTLTRVLEAASISLSASSSAVNARSPVTLTATVGPQAPETVSPTGTVTFSDGSTTIGTVALSNGTATLTTADLAAATHTIAATYNGDPTFASATSAPSTVTVSSGSGSTGGGTTGTGGGTTPGAGSGSEPPALTGLRQTHSRWRLGKGSAVLSAARKPPIGTTFGFRLNERATVRFSFARIVRGHKEGGPRGTLSLNADAGANRVAFQGRLPRSKRLTPGRYTVTVTASAHGLSSAPRRLTFTIVAG